MAEPKRYKEKVPKFSRPPWFEEVATSENSKKFNALPGWQRHYIKSLIKHGELDKAAKEAGISRHHKDKIDTKLASQATIRDALHSGGIDADYIVSKLKEAIECETIRLDKHGNPVTTLDIPSRLKAIDMVLKVRGDYDAKKHDHSEKTKGLVELFEDTDVGQRRSKAITVDSKTSED